jgi:SET family sugar efflux transporter-like MFS transporter
VSAAGWIRTLAPLGFIATLVGLTGSFVAPFLPVFLTQVLHASPGQVTLLLFASPVAGVIVASVVARISDRAGARQKVLRVAATAGVAGFTVYALSRNYWTLLAAALTLVAMTSAMMPQVYAFGRELMQRQAPARAAMGISTLRMAISLAWAAGAPLGAVVIGLISFNGLFFAAAGAYLVMLLLITGVLTRRNSAKSGDTGDSTRMEPGTVVRDSVAAAVHVRPPRRLLVATTAAFVVLQGVTTLTVISMPLYVSHELHGTLSNAGMVLGLCAALEIPLMPLFGSFTKRWPLRGLLLTGCGFGIAYSLVLSLADSVWQVAVAQILHACFVCTVGGLGITYFQELLPSALGRATTMFSNAGAMSGMIAGLVLGVAQVHGYRLSSVVALGLCVTGTVILALTRGSAEDLTPSHTEDLTRSPAENLTRSPAEDLTRRPSEDLTRSAAGQRAA